MLVYLKGCQTPEKCTTLFQQVCFESIDVVAMTANCCQSLLPTIREAIQRSGKSIPIHEWMIAPDGEIYQ